MVFPAHKYFAFDVQGIVKRNHNDVNTKPSVGKGGGKLCRYLNTTKLGEVSGTDYEKNAGWSKAWNGW